MFITCRYHLCIILLGLEKSERSARALAGPTHNQRHQWQRRHTNNDAKTRTLVQYVYCRYTEGNSTL